MDVRMPDGIVIQNVPEGTTQMELVTRLSKRQAEAPTPPLAQRAISAVSAAPGGYGIPRGVTQGVASAVLPTLGAVGGAVFTIHV